jgi:hypothetical protein
VIFPQTQAPGEAAQSDFPHMTSLGVTLGGVAFPHLVYHLVLVYSNIEAVQICFLESFESLVEGFERGIWQVGGVPRQHRTDHLGAAIHPPTGTTRGRVASSRCTSASRPAHGAANSAARKCVRLVLTTTSNASYWRLWHPISWRSLATITEVEREDAVLHRQWQLRLERARYDAERARRQYDAVEPENRTVARSLEAQWEDKLRAVEQFEREYESWRHRQQLVLSDDDRDQILALAWPSRTLRAPCGRAAGLSCLSGSP